MPRVELRRHLRILVPDSHAIRAASRDGRTLEGDVTVIGLGGMFIRTANLYPLSAVLQLEIRGASVTFNAECTVRNPASNGLGVEFTGLLPEDENRLRFLLALLKPQPTEPVAAPASPNGRESA